MSRPIQIILNDRDFQTDRDRGGGGPSTDFYWNNDAGFKRHKSILRAQINSISDSISRQDAGSVGIVKVELRRRALAKGHRPIQKLFTPTLCPTIGGQDLGTILVKARPAALRTIASLVNDAEDIGQSKFDEEKQKVIPAPSRLRSEVGAIEKVSLYSSTDRRKFDVETAVIWLADKRTGGSYIVELFEYPPARPLWDSLPRDEQQLYQSFVSGLSMPQFSGLVASRLDSARPRASNVGIRLSNQDAGPTLAFLSSVSQSRTARAAGDISQDISKHAMLLKFLDNHPLVRSVALPPIVRRTDTPSVHGPIRRQGLSQTQLFFMPERIIGQKYPRIGIVDGGVADCLSDWVLDRWDTLADEDTDVEHGTFIGGIVIAGKSANSNTICVEDDGAEIVDIRVLPSEHVADAFQTYYPNGALEFFDEIEMAVADAKAKHGVRIFNLSLNVENPVALDSYSLIAEKIDQVSEDNDVLFVISAGNADDPDTRPEWNIDREIALADLATSRNDGIWVPAESVRSVTVAAVNPPHLTNVVAGAPARYSRRGPGIRAAVKPDVAQVGGSGTSCPINGLGLRSLLPDGSLTTGCGTSYAAPQVAKTLALLDHQIEGDVSRETLVALLLHSAQLPQILNHKSLATVARDLVGFGIPADSHTILEGQENQITLVFASRLMREQQVVFDFTWPASLVGPSGKCRGDAALTLVSTPPLDRRYGAEFVRVELSASLQQEQITSDGIVSWKGQMEPIYLPGKTDDDPMFEAKQIEHVLKWSPVKAWKLHIPKGRGKSSSWRMKINYLTRAGEAFPDEGVPFTAVLTLSDKKGDAPIFDEMRQSLLSRNVKVEDIRTAARIATRT